MLNWSHIFLSTFLYFQVSNNASTHDNTSFRCVFWDFTKADGVGDWSTAGCVLARQTDNTVSCNCSHATNFAILVVRKSSEKFIFLELKTNNSKFKIHMPDILCFLRFLILWRNFLRIWIFEFCGELSQKLRLNSEYFHLGLTPRSSSVGPLLTNTLWIYYECLPTLANACQCL